MAKKTKMTKRDWENLQERAGNWLMNEMSEDERERFKKEGVSYEDALAKFPELPHTHREYIRGFIDGRLGFNA